MALPNPAISGRGRRRRTRGDLAFIGLVAATSTTGAAARSSGQTAPVLPRGEIFREFRVASFPRGHGRLCCRNDDICMHS